MPRVVKPLWGRQGMVPLRGFGLTDREFEDRGLKLAGHRPGDRGFLHDDEQIEALARYLNVPRGSVLPHHFRLRLNFIRGFLLKSWLQDAQIPAQRKRNAALLVLSKVIKSLLEPSQALVSVPNWPLTETFKTDCLSPFNIFITFPSRLNLMSAIAKAASRDCAPVPKSKAHQSCAVFLRGISASATDLADTVRALDFASKDDVLKCLPWTNDYAMDSVAEVVLVAKRLSIAVDTALQAGRKRCGPRQSKDLRSAIFWLIELYEDCGGRLTHSPYKKKSLSDYDGRPNSAAGQFVLAFINMCNDKISPQTISTVMAEMVKRRSDRDKMLRGGSI